MEHLAQILVLLGVAVAIVVTFQRLHIPTSLGYLLVGVILGPHTIGPIVYVPEFRALAEFGVVFLLFTIGLNFSLPQLQAMRHQVLGFGTAQVALTTIVAGSAAWLAGLPAVSAFVVGAVFAQSSTTIIGRQLTEQGEENTPHGRLGLAMSVFQDVTAVPFLVVIPVLGLSVGADVLASALGWAMVKAVLAIVIVLFAGRWLLRPLFRMVTQRRSAEIFTLTVLLVALFAAWSTNSLGLSLAFGAFLAGMMLGETEFRHEVATSIRPFRDVLLGLFFVGIGMLINPASIPGIWHWAVLGALLILLSKIIIVAAMVRFSGIDLVTAMRTGLLLAVGGEFGFALLAIAIDGNVVNAQVGQIALTSVLLSMVAGAFLIRFNKTLAMLSSGQRASVENAQYPLEIPESQVVIGGYGRMGHTVAALLKARGISFSAFDTDPERVAQGRRDGHSVMYGDISDPDFLAQIHVELASLVVLTVDGEDAALQVVDFLRRNCPHVPVISRARDLESRKRLLNAGATSAHPEAIEASLRLGESALQMLNVQADEIARLMQNVRDWDYKTVLEDEKKEQ